MRALAVNLKLFYQCRGLWFWYLPAIIFGFAGIVGGISGHNLIGYLFVSIFMGFLTATLQRDILSKPFSFCMPGYRNLMRRLILGIGIVINLLLGLIFFRYHEFGILYILLIVLAGGFAGMIAYLLSIWCAFLARTMAPLGALLFYLIVLPSTLNDKYLQPVAEIIFSYPLLVIGGGIAACVAVWNWVGGDSLARRYCGQEVLSAADSWGNIKIGGMRRKIILEKSSPRVFWVYDRVERLFLAGMQKCHPLSAKRYIIGALHVVSGSIYCFPRTMPVLLFMLILGILFFGYIVPARFGVLLFMIPALGVLQIDLIPHRSMVLPAGRAERYYGVLVSGLAVTGVSTLLVVAMALISFLLVGRLPDITVQGNVLSFHAIDPRGFYFSLFLMPLALALGIFFSRKLFSLFMGLAAIIALMVVTARVVFELMTALLFPESMVGAVALVAAAWIIFALVVGYHCRRQSLVAQG